MEIFEFYLSTMRRVQSDVKRSIRIGCILAEEMQNKANKKKLENIINILNKINHIFKTEIIDGNK